MRRCSVDGCGLAVKCKGLCNSHYEKSRQTAPCMIDGCSTKSRSKGMCHHHYRQWRRHGDPAAMNRQPNGAGYLLHGYRIVSVDGRQMKEHRYVMEQLLGRPLLAHENVHHINGVRDDNRPENLELWSTSQPSGQRIEDKLDWAVSLISQYAPHLLAKEHANV